MKESNDVFWKTVLSKIENDLDDMRLLLKKKV